MMRPRCNRRNETFGITFTFTHTHLGRLLGDWLVGEYANPDLSLTLHVAGHSHTGSLDLTAGNPFRLESLDAERTECKLIASLGTHLSYGLFANGGIWFFRL